MQPPRDEDADHDPSPDAAATPTPADPVDPAPTQPPQPGVTSSPGSAETESSAEGQKINLERLRNASRVTSGNTEKTLSTSVSTSAISQVAQSLADSVRLPKITDPSRNTRATSFNTPALDQLQRLQESREEHQRELASLADDMAQARAKKEARATAQAEATLEIAAAQQRLRELQEASIELATQQAEATAALARSQQATLAAIHEELAVLREQQETLNQQSEGQQQLIHSGWSGGVVMEWTLFVAIIAAAATIGFAVQPARDLTWPFWISGAIAIAVSSAALALWQKNRRPSKN